MRHLVQDLAVLLTMLGYRTKSSRHPWRHGVTFLHSPLPPSPPSLTLWNSLCFRGASPVTVRCASPVTAGVQVRSLSITDDLSHSPSDLPTRWYGTIMVHFLFFSPKKIPHHVENAWYYDPRRSNKNADAPMILYWIALSTMLYRLLCSESATISRLASNHMLCRHVWFFTISGTHHRQRRVYSVDNVNWSKIFVERIDIMREVGAMVVAACLTRYNYIRSPAAAK